MTPIDFRLNIAAQLIKARHKRGLTQKQLAEASGITQSNISYIENGLSNVIIDTLHQLSSALNFELVINLR
jgi:transcriptional regulator with XRE-family HTH domain